ncbi:hypothetical protein FHR32_001295 [Streptosporangium album]|uniref:Uncharacterized protein n=1 Tax=Streptosporangium album TaxID=47479 RepID=A0A7W7W8H6_9ACTN|nr:hypothetical protein [Streptosporangium album]MBB4936990.1 hypothetical protein [Streptosporangium album]
MLQVLDPSAVRRWSRLAAVGVLRRELGVIFAGRAGGVRCAGLRTAGR